MADIIVGPMLRYVSEDSATIWVEVDEPFTVEVLGRQQRTFSYDDHHYALVIIEHLAPGSATEYDVRLDGQLRWPPPGSAFPPSQIRTYRRGDPVRLLFGSCRAAAPHEPPYTLEPSEAKEGKGVDALRSVALRMLESDSDRWPNMIVMLGDQVYADEASPGVRARIGERRGASVPPEGVVADFEEYTWLYHESWTPDVERWLFSTVPSAMIFDDHETIDDWNISMSWVADARTKPWWSDHIVGGMVSYWIYQHLGNLSPTRIAEEGMLDELLAAGDGTDILRRWALESESFTPVPGGYQFSFDRHLGDVHVVMIDCRNGRLLEPGARQMVDDDEWRWITERANEPYPHLVLASTLPMFAPGGLHGIQQWSEAVCDGAWSPLMKRPGEWLRRALDLEHWPAFDRSFRAIERLLIDLATPGPAHEPPATITILGGDIHFAFVTGIGMPEGSVSRVRQVICSPFRNELHRRDRRMMRFGASRAGRRIGAMLARSARRGPSALTWELSHDPVFGNNVGMLRFDGDEAALTIEATTAGVPGPEGLRIVVADAPRRDV